MRIMGRLRLELRKKGGRKFRVDVNKASTSLQQVRQYTFGIDTELFGDEIKLGTMQILFLDIPKINRCITRNDDRVLEHNSI